MVCAREAALKKETVSGGCGEGLAGVEVFELTGQADETIDELFPTS